MGYIGLTWAHFFYQQGTSGSGPGFANGLVSGANVGFSDAFEPSATISATTPFTLSSAYLTAARDDSLEIDIDAYNSANTLLFQKSVTVGDAAATAVTFGWAGVSRVVFNYQGDFDAFHNFVVDDLVINGSSDETVAAPLPGAGYAGLVLLAGLGLRSRVRRVATSSCPTG